MSTAIDKYKRDLKSANRKFRIFMAFVLTGSASWGYYGLHLSLLAVFCINAPIYGFIWKATEIDPDWV